MLRSENTASNLTPAFLVIRREGSGKSGFEHHHRDQQIPQVRVIHFSDLYARIDLEVTRGIILVKWGRKGSREPGPPAVGRGTRQTAIRRRTGPSERSCSATSNRGRGQGQGHGRVVRRVRRANVSHQARRVGLLRRRWK